ncbi:Arrestin-related trafficking adapter 5 [Candida viswanathii]|uniref:Arrestin-related trafficking adapter 5 n=1 Tax=Candida viswanathii TaxID=5486 RepID=A0A367Y6J9_9ASCO|nr:Arrestin-related trafficking adapter 5 [Candida viswanathii]
MFNHHLNLALFDIKLKSQHKNLLLIKGNESEVEAVPFEGSVKLSLNEDIHLKKISLCLTGEFYYEYMDKVTKEQFLDRLCVLKIDWNNLLTDENGHVVFGNYGDSTIPMYKLKNLKSGTGSGIHTPGNLSPGPSSGFNSGTATPTRPTALRTKSTPIFLKDKDFAQPPKILKIPKSGIDGTPFKDMPASAHHSFLLPKGNYSLPFKVFLPANVPETVEGLPLGTILYKLQCNIERGRFEKSANLNKHVRIVRTLHPQNLNLCDSIDVDNTWVGKVQYNLCMNKKGVPVGASIPIDVTLVPVMKGLSLKGIHGCIVEHYHAEVGPDRSPEYERIIGKQELQIPNTDELPYEKWQFRTHYKVPDNLKKICQSCDIRGGMVVVKHRLRLGIQLRNPGGHVSELRANLPICVYISANSGHVVGRHYDVDNHHGTFQLDYLKEDCLFKKDKGETHHSPAGTPAETDAEHPQGGDSDSEDEDEDLDRNEAAPPLYEKHVFDKIYDMNLPQTPLEQFRSQQATPLHSNANSSSDVAGYFDIPITQALENNLKKTLAQTPMFDMENISHIPSYTEALDDDDESDQIDEFAPEYSDSSSSASGATSPMNIMLPKNQSTGHLRIPFKGSSAPSAKSGSTTRLDKMSLDSRSLSPSVKSRFSFHSRKKDK